MSALGFYPVKGHRELVIGYFTFVTDGSAAPDITETGGLSTLSTMKASHDPMGIVSTLVRTSTGLFTATLRGSYGEVYAQAQAHKTTLHSAVVSKTTVTTIVIAVRDNLGALVDVDEVTVGVSYVVLLDAKALTRP